MRIWRAVIGAACLSAVLAAGQAKAQTVFFQDFESGLGASESVGGSFAINNTGFGNNGTKMMGHAVNYGNNEYSFYQVQLDLTGATGVVMQFDYAGNFETHFDRFNVLASTGAISPPAGLLNPTGGSDMQFIDLGHDHNPNLGRFAYDTTAASGGQSGVARFDLGAFDGQIVNLRFQFGSDESVTQAGFNMDNLRVTARDLAVPEPGAGAVLAGLAVTGLVAIRRRRSAS